MDLRASLATFRQQGMPSLMWCSGADECHFTSEWVSLADVTPHISMVMYLYDLHIWQACCHSPAGQQAPRLSWAHLTAHTLVFSALPAATWQALAQQGRCPPCQGCTLPVCALQVVPGPACEPGLVRPMHSPERNRAEASHLAPNSPAACSVHWRVRQSSNGLVYVCICNALNAVKLRDGLNLQSKYMRKRIDVPSAS